MKTKININADLGESFGNWKMGSDSEMLSLVNSANLACGFHAGDPLVILRTLRDAHKYCVGVGAHPSFPDLQGFGRRPMQLSEAELEATLLYQLSALQGMAHTQNTTLEHVKPHGALNNMACSDIELARQIVNTIKIFNDQLVLLAPACSALLIAGEEAGLRVAAEIFADRAYQDDAQLVPRSEKNAMVHGAENSYQHVIKMLEAKAIISTSGKKIPCNIHSICVHGDNADAVKTARYLREKLQANNYELVSLKEMF
ncbi:LamB/YcsF family protein [Polynucleobacter sp. MWH-HuK1]|uniref:LamB/YcsF family protein n=1 Tax=Polynucleobacter sp. MWH-HuK1 TaxID=1743158 RepID=UPI001C0C2D1C|nr:5-oxoprolinase subunit PxpA [Polynucleobacter sp. MWH-HuK1]MBU3566565.1 5-oxoprolinase subunit PxpA [Polynucleobacter sp. MWH-HuK1]